MKRSRRRLFFRWGGVVGVLGGALLFVAAARFLEDDLAAARRVFRNSPSVTVQEREGEQYLSPVYDLSAYTAYDDMSFFAPRSSSPLGEGSQGGERYWIDGAARRVMENIMRHARGRRDSTRTPAALYLLSPSVHREAVPSGILHITYPPAGAAFPPNMCAPTIEWADAHNDVWQVTVALHDGRDRVWSEVTRRRSWTLPEAAWTEVVSAVPGTPLSVQVKGLRSSQLSAAGTVVQSTPPRQFRISPWPADSVIVYRMVIPPFNTRKTPDTFYRRLDSHAEHPFLLARNHYCFNCHTFSSKTGSRGMLSVQARYMSPGAALPVYLAVYDLDAQKGWKVKLPFDIQMSTFMAWSRDGRYLAMSANQQLVTFHPTVYETQFAGEPTSDIAIYDVRTNSARPLAGADDPHLLEVLPRFSPDGKRVVFSAAPVGHHPAQTRYGLYEVPFNDGQGGKPRPVPSACSNGRSNYYARFSPDGRWLSFCQADAGILIKPSSDIWLMPADFSKPAHRLNCNSPYTADSWHSWSSNSHWLVFASKRDDGIFARLYLTEIDDQGHAAAAVRLPLKQIPMASFNIPEFVASGPRLSERDLYRVARVEAPAREAHAEEVSR